MKRTQRSMQATGETVLPEAKTATLNAIMQMATFSPQRKPEQMSRIGGTLEGLPWSTRAWHVCKDTSQNLGDPAGSSVMLVSITNRKEGCTEDRQGVGSVHSTRRTGKPFTWGRD